MPEDEKNIWKARQERAVEEHKILYPDWNYCPRQPAEKQEEQRKKQEESELKKQQKEAEKAAKKNKASAYTPARSSSRAYTTPTSSQDDFDDGFAAAYPHSHYNESDFDELDPVGSAGTAPVAGSGYTSVAHSDPFASPFHRRANVATSGYTSRIPELAENGYTSVAHRDSFTSPLRSQANSTTSDYITSSPGQAEYQNDAANLPYQSNDNNDVLHNNGAHQLEFEDEFDFDFPGMEQIARFNAGILDSDSVNDMNNNDSTDNSIVANSEHHDINTNIGNTAMHNDEAVTNELMNQDTTVYYETGIPETATNEMAIQDPTVHYEGVVTTETIYQQEPIAYHETANQQPAAVYETVDQQPAVYHETTTHEPTVTVQHETANTNVAPVVYNNSEEACLAALAEGANFLPLDFDKPSSSTLNDDNGNASPVFETAAAPALDVNNNSSTTTMMPAAPDAVVGSYAADATQDYYSQPASDNDNNAAPVFETTTSADTVSASSETTTMMPTTAPNDVVAGSSPAEATLHPAFDNIFKKAAKKAAPVVESVASADTVVAASETTMVPTTTTSAVVVGSHAAEPTLHPAFGNIFKKAAAKNAAPVSETTASSADTGASAVAMMPTTNPNDVVADSYAAEEAPTTQEDYHSQPSFFDNEASVTHYSNNMSPAPTSFEELLDCPEPYWQDQPGFFNM